MKKLPQIILFICSFLFFQSFAQHIPFQGKLLENGQPVNGIKSFTFSINQGMISWSETHSNLPVNNGLYAVVLGSVSPLPTNLFQSQTGLNLYISVDGVPLDTIPIFPPLESDPTVPTSVKDGISWNEIGNIPPKLYADTSATNELQHLSLQGNLLSISNGNTVKIPVLADSTFVDGEVVINGGFQVGVPDTSIILDVEQPTGATYSLETTFWQSFTANHTGKLTSVCVEFANSLSTSVNLKVYPGEGTTGQILFDHTWSSGNFTPAIQYQSFPFADFGSVNLTYGQKYTFLITGISNQLMITKNQNNPYTGGITGFGQSTDLKFKVYLELITPIGFIVTEDGNVGIGTSTPSSKLEVQGEIKSVINGTEFFMVPKGAIIMWSGTLVNIPSGWALCDGNNGTPNLKDRFIVGAGNSYPVAVIGGEATHTLTIAEMPAHNHNHAPNVYDSSGGGSSYSWRGDTDNVYNPIVSSSTGGGGAHNNLPPYYALAFIMKL